MATVNSIFNGSTQTLPDVSSVTTPAAPTSGFFTGAVPKVVCGVDGTVEFKDTDDQLMAAVAYGDSEAVAGTPLGVVAAARFIASGSIFAAETTVAAFVSGTSQAMVVRTAYTPENAALTTFTLPGTVAKGEILAVRGYGTGGWKIAQNASQQIHRPAGSTTAGVGGSVDSATDYDCITIMCVVANTTFVVISQVGSPTFT